jgi:hypothetical protein
MTIIARRRITKGTTKLGLGGSDPVMSRMNTALASKVSKMMFSSQAARVLSASPSKTGGDKRRLILPIIDLLLEQHDNICAEAKGIQLSVWRDLSMTLRRPCYLVGRMRTSKSLLP